MINRYDVDKKAIGSSHLIPLKVRPKVIGAGVNERFARITHTIFNSSHSI